MMTTKIDAESERRVLLEQRLDVAEMRVNDFTNQLNAACTVQEQERAGYKDRIARLQESLWAAEEKIEDLDYRLQTAEFWVDYYWSWWNYRKQPDPQ